MLKYNSVCYLFLFFLIGCDNNPYPKDESKSNTYYSSFSERPKTLDPAEAYSSNEYTFIAQIYEPPLQYHYLKRPYELIPLSSESMPEISYFDQKGMKVSQLHDNIEHTVYKIKIKRGIFYQPHPAFAKNDSGFVYHSLDRDKLSQLGIEELSDFKLTGTRELTSKDFVYQIKRMAHPNIDSPIYGILSNYIKGFAQFGKKIKNLSINKESRDIYNNLKDKALDGVRVIDSYTYEITINKRYPQFIYWLAMPFFAPIPWEGDVFYDQAGMDDRNIYYDWYPIGTGPFMLIKNNPNRNMVLEKNPNFHGERYPQNGTLIDRNKGLLADANKELPFIDKAIYILEKEAIPRWNKFLQGYYDQSGISSDSFDEAIFLDEQGGAHLTESMQNKEIYLQTSISPMIYYIGFNMLDDIVGGYSKKARFLRQAISVAVNYEEYISIFLNGRGVVAHGPVPPNVLKDLPNKVNNYVFDVIDGKTKRKTIDKAIFLLEQAGFKNGIDPKTKKPLILNYDVPATGGADDKARFDWMRKQFNKLGIQLNIRSTQYNRFQEKMRDGNAQIFTWGWNADYPDPENFLFLLYGPNGKVKYKGENAANYDNSNYNKLFEKMQNMDISENRTDIVSKMIEIVQKDAVWIWGVHPKNLVLAHHWNRVTKPSAVANNTLKYLKIDPMKRSKDRSKWNKPNYIPLVILLLILAISILPVIITNINRKKSPKYKIGKK